MTSPDGIRDMIEDMDEWSLKQLVLRMSETMGSGCIDLVRSAAGADIPTDRGTIVGNVHNALLSMDEVFLSGPCPGSYDGCRSPRDLAYMLTSEAVRDSCRDDVSTLMRVGRRKDAERYMRSVAEALSTVRCAMTEHVPSCCRDLSDWLLSCVSSGDIMGGFDC